MTNNYKCLAKQIYTLENFSLVPIRREDRFKIMEWRNSQIYHLRQETPLTLEAQDKYFREIVEKLFTLPNPNQILFSYLKENICIGYGGLVHIDWNNLTAELSFIMDTQLENKEFNIHWDNFLKMIEQVAFENLTLRKIYTYAFDLRPKLYKVLEENSFIREALLKEHVVFNGKYINVIIHSKIKNGN